MASGQRDSCWNEWSGRYDPSITRYHYSGGVQSSDGRGSGFVWNGSRIRTQAGKTFGILIVTGGRSDAAITRMTDDRRTSATRRLITRTFDFLPPFNRGPRITATLLLTYSSTVMLSTSLSSDTIRDVSNIDYSTLKLTAQPACAQFQPLRNLRPYRRNGSRIYRCNFFSSDSRRLNLSVGYKNTAWKLIFDRYYVMENPGFEKMWV